MGRSSPSTSTTRRTSTARMSSAWPHDAHGNRQLILSRKVQRNRVVPALFTACALALQARTTRYPLLRIGQLQSGLDRTMTSKRTASGMRQLTVELTPYRDFNRSNTTTRTSTSGRTVGNG